MEHKEYTIVGLPYYELKDCNHILRDSTSYLVVSAEPDNVHSSSALVVHLRAPYTTRKYKIGYISGRESEKLNEYLKGRSAILKVIDVRSSNIKVKLETVSMLYTQPSKEEVTTSSVTKLNEKGITMFEKIVENNATMAKSAAFLEAGRIANNTASKFVASKAPLMVKGYVETAFGKLLIANAASVAVEKFRPADRKLAKLANAMITQAYQEVYQLVDIEKMLNEMLSSESVKAAMAKLDNSDAEVPA